MAFQTTTPIACEHAVPFTRSCPECVLASWETTPAWTEPSRLRDEIQRDARLERRAENQASIREWEAGLER